MGTSIPGPKEINKPKDTELDTLTKALVKKLEAGHRQFDRAETGGVNSNLREQVFSSFRQAGWTIKETTGEGGRGQTTTFYVFS